MTMHEDALRRASSQGGWDRRTLLKTFGAGAVAMAGIPLLAACTGGSAPSGSAGTQDSLTFGSGSSDDVPKAAYKAVTDAFEKKSGIKVTTNVVAHNDFQNKINTYLQGSPDDAFTWFAGYRMQYYAGKGLLAPIDDVWEKIGAQLLRRPEEGLHRRRRQEVPRPELQLPVGLLLPQERLGREGLHRPDDLR